MPSYTQLLLVIVPLGSDPPWMGDHHVGIGFVHFLGNQSNFHDLSSTTYRNSMTFRLIPSLTFRLQRQQPGQHEVKRIILILKLWLHFDITGENWNTLFCENFHVFPGVNTICRFQNSSESWINFCKFSWLFQLFHECRNHVGILFWCEWAAFIHTDMKTPHVGPDSSCLPSVWTFS